MSAEQFVKDARRALGRLIVAGAVAARADTTTTFRSLESHARSLGLSELAARLSELAQQLGGPRPMADDDARLMASRILRIHDRIEALGSALAIASVEKAFGDGIGSGAKHLTSH